MCVLLEILCVPIKSAEENIKYFHKCQQADLKMAMQTLQTLVLNTLNIAY